MSRATRYQQLVNTYGLLPSEAKQLSHTSKSGLQAPYMRRLLVSRRALFLNAKRYNWSETQYRDVIKRQYADRGALKQDILGRIRADIWQMVRWFEGRTPIPDAYESPWRKKAQRRSTRKREYKRVTRRQMLNDWINQLDRQIANPNITEARRQRLSTQRDNLRRQLDILK